VVEAVAEADEFQDGRGARRGSLRSAPWKIMGSITFCSAVMTAIS